MKNINDILGDGHTGVQPAMGRDEYMSEVGLNPSSLKKGLADGVVSTLAVKHAYENPNPPTQAQLDRFAPGTLGHMCWLEPERVGRQSVAIWSEGRRAGKAWKEFQAANADKLIIKAEDYDRVRKCCDVVLDHLRVHRPDVTDLLAEGESEVAVFSREYDMLVKGQLDWINTTANSAIVDLKFSDTHSESIADKNVSRFHYDLSLACYNRWFQRESGKQVSRVVIITVCTTPPYGVIVRELGEMALTHGWDKADRVLGSVRDSLSLDEWPIPCVSGEYVPPHWELDDVELEGFDVETASV